MKVILLLACIVSLPAFSACKVALDINLFSNPFTNIKINKQYNKIEKAIDRLGHQLVEKKDASYLVNIDVGIERTGMRQDILLSDIKIMKVSSQEIVFKDIKNKKVNYDKILSDSDILKFTKRHISKELPTCN